MKEIKIKVVDWWNDGEADKNYFLNFLSKSYKVTLSDKPDYLLCSLFGNDHLNYDCVKIFFTGENFTPDFNLYDYAMGFDYLEFGDRYLRYPLWLLYPEALHLALNKHKNISEDFAKRGFCSFVVSNGSNAHPIREQFFDKLSEVDFVASGGAFRNNIGKRVEDKNEFVEQYKFNIAFENSQTQGYCTEKLFQALGAKSIPIYWGWGKEEFVNPKSFINPDDFSTMQEAIDFVKELHSNDEKYLSMLKEPVFLHPNIQEYYEAKLQKFFDHIFEQPLNECKRIHRVGTREGYFNDCLEWIKYKERIEGGGAIYRFLKQIPYLRHLKRVLFKLFLGR